MATAVENMSINHRSADIAMPEQLLNRANVMPGCQQMGGKRMAQDVWIGRLGETNLPGGFFEGALRHGLVEMVTAVNPRAGIDTDRRGRKDPLPALGLGRSLSLQKNPHLRVPYIGSYLICSSFGVL